MLHKLRMQFIIVNAVVIVAVFTFLAGCAWFFLQERMMERVVHISANIMQDKDAGLIRNLPQGPPPPPRDIELFFVRPPEHTQPFLPPFLVASVNANGVIEDYSTVNNFTPEQVDKLAKQVMSAPQNSGQLKIDDHVYYYAHMLRNYGTGEILFVQDLERDRLLLRDVVYVLLAAGLVCLALSVLGSVFLGNRAIKPIAKTWQQQKDFLADASHELRTPLSVIRTNLEIVQDNPDELVKSQCKWLQNIQEETTHMTSLVDNLLFLARTDANQDVLERSDFCLQEAVGHAIGVFEPVACSKGVRLTEGMDETPISFCGDENRLSQVVAILLDNAIRHTPVGGRVTVELEKKDGRIALSVSDNGAGIAPENLPHVFERFYQGDAAHASGKAGLGLAIAKSIVERHGGKIRATSQPRVETRLSIELPIRV